MIASFSGVIEVASSFFKVVTIISLSILIRLLVVILTPMTIGDDRSDRGILTLTRFSGVTPVSLFVMAITRWTS